GIAGGRLDAGAARPELAGALGLRDHGQADAVLDAAARVELLELGEDGGLDSGGDLVEAHKGCVADEVENGLREFHLFSALRAAGGTLIADSIPRSARCSAPNQRKKTTPAATPSVTLPKIISSAPAIVWSMSAV